MMWDPIVPPETPWWSRLGIALFGAVGTLFMLALSTALTVVPLALAIALAAWLLERIR